MAQNCPVAKRHSNRKLTEARNVPELTVIVFFSCMFIMIITIYKANPTVISMPRWLINLSNTNLFLISTIYCYLALKFLIFQLCSTFLNKYATKKKVKQKLGNFSLTPLTLQDSQGLCIKVSCWSSDDCSSYHEAALCKPGWGTVWLPVRLPSLVWLRLPCTAPWCCLVASAALADCTPALGRSRLSVFAANTLKEAHLQTFGWVFHIQNFYFIWVVYWCHLVTLIYQLSCCSSPLVRFSIKPPVPAPEPVFQVQTLSRMSSPQGPGFGVSTEPGGNDQWLSECFCLCRKHFLLLSVELPLPAKHSPA